MSVASQAATHSGMFAKHSVELDPTQVGQTQVGFEHTGSRLYEDTAGKITSDSQNIFTNNPALANATKVDANIGSGTDLIKVIPGGGRASAANYSNVFDSVKSYVDTLPSGATKDSALQFLKDAEWMKMTGMNNEYLNGMRTLETFDGVLHGYVNS